MTEEVRRCLSPPARAFSRWPETVIGSENAETKDEGVLAIVKTL
jgi:hypothetical protein